MTHANSFADSSGKVVLEPLTRAATPSHNLPGHTREPKPFVPGRAPSTPGVPCRLRRDALPVREDPPGGRILPQSFLPRRLEE